MNRHSAFFLTTLGAIAATLALAADPARADDITIASERFVPTQVRSAVKKQVLRARAAGESRQDNESEASAIDRPAVATTVQRDDVRAAARRVGRHASFLQDYPA